MESKYILKYLEVLENGGENRQTVAFAGRNAESEVPLVIDILSLQAQNKSKTTKTSWIINRLGQIFIPKPITSSAYDRVEFGSKPLVWLKRSADTAQLIVHTVYTNSYNLPSVKAKHRFAFYSINSTLSMSDAKIQVSETWAIDILSSDTDSVSIDAKTFL